MHPFFPPPSTLAQSSSIRRIASSTALSKAARFVALLRRDELLDHFASCLDTQVRAESPDDDQPSAIAAAGIVGGIEALLYSRLNRGETDELESLLPSLMYFAVLPYEGHATASEELAVAAR